MFGAICCLNTKGESLMDNSKKLGLESNSALFEEGMEALQKITDAEINFCVNNVVRPGGMQIPEDRRPTEFFTLTMLVLGEGECEDEEVDTVDLPDDLWTSDDDEEVDGLIDDPNPQEIPSIFDDETVPGEPTKVATKGPTREGDW